MTSPESLINHNFSTVANQLHHDARYVPRVIYTAMRSPDKCQSEIGQHGVDVDLMYFIKVIEMFTNIDPPLEVVWNGKFQLSTLVLQETIDIPRPVVKKKRVRII